MPKSWMDGWNEINDTAGAEKPTQGRHDSARMEWRRTERRVTHITRCRLGHDRNKNPILVILDVANLTRI